MNRLKKPVLLFLFFFSITLAQSFDNYSQLKSNYIQLSGELFKAVQLSGIFKDSKTFVDALPKKDRGEIIKMYDSLKSEPDFDLAQFIFVNFIIPEEAEDKIANQKKETMDEHIENLWEELIRTPDTVRNNFSTLIPLKHPYVVPGGRFREVYYWDSFFTMLGLLADGREYEAENMVLNFAYLLNEFGMIPNGNRIYYLTRSQPPYFSLMVDIICRYKNDFNWGLQFIDELETEYSFWMNGEEKVMDKIPSSKGILPDDTKNQHGITFANQSSAFQRVVNIKLSGVLNRYYDFDSIPREESFKEDYKIGIQISDSLRSGFYLNLRAAAESGWDFSSRWFSDGKTLSSIITTDIIPVDLNCLLFFLEDRLSFFYGLKGDESKKTFYSRKAEARKKLINEIFWNDEEQFYFDYNWKTGEHTKRYSLAGCFPLYFKAAWSSRVNSVAEKLEKMFLKPGGLITTIYETGQQWDAPNGWAPLQWIAIKGLKEYGINQLADEIKKRWLALNKNVYDRTGKMVEKYNVENLQLFAGGGEYPLQDGFGWTNGVAAALLSGFDEKFLFK